MLMHILETKLAFNSHQIKLKCTKISMVLSHSLCISSGVWPRCSGVHSYFLEISDVHELVLLLLHAPVLFQQATEDTQCLPECLRQVSSTLWHTLEIWISVLCANCDTVCLIVFSVGRLWQSWAFNTITLGNTLE